MIKFRRFAHHYANYFLAVTTLIAVIFAIYFEIYKYPTDWNAYKSIVSIAGLNLILAIFGFFNNSMLIDSPRELGVLIPIVTIICIVILLTLKLNPLFIFICLIFSATAEMEIVFPDHR